MESREIHFACVVDAIPEKERPMHFALLVDLFGTRAQERRDVPGGYAFRFPAEAFEDLSRFVSTERRCCPFLTFTITIAPASGPLWLHITGPEGARQFLAEEFLAEELPRIAGES